MRLPPTDGAGQHPPAHSRDSSLGGDALACTSIRGAEVGMDVGQRQSASTNQEHSHDHDYDRSDQATWHLRYSVTGLQPLRMLRTVAGCQSHRARCECRSSPVTGIGATEARLHGAAIRPIQSGGFPLAPHRWAVEPRRRTGPTPRTRSAPACSPNASTTSP